MTTVRLLYDLQELDLQIEQHRTTLTSLEAELNDTGVASQLREAVERERRRLQELRLKQRNQELDVESLRRKLQDLEGRLYSGRVTNPRELESMEKERAILKRQLSGEEDKLLETMLSLEETQERLKEGEERLKQAEEVYQVRRRELTREVEQLLQVLKGLELRRQETASRLGPQELALYERLRASKGGRVVAKVERGMCLGCRMTLPTHELQRVRVSLEPVFCSSCGRILLIS
jgi:hypothetical protein